jgi:DNA-binding CsgD family transcriptional regulator
LAVLTDSEMEMVVFVVQGLTNRELAKRLLSRRLR